MNSTMQDVPLSITALFRRGADVFPDSEVITFEGERARHTPYKVVAQRVQRLAAALQGLGIAPGDRVGTLCWNHQEHLEAYFAIPCMGAVLHTLNLRLPPAQLARSSTTHRIGSSSSTTRSPRSSRRSSGAARA